MTGSLSVPPPPTVPSGRRYELRGRIGAGNHGVVFRAHDHQIRRDVAIKRFSHFLVDDPRAMRRITREVATMARVSHPHVVTVHDLVDLVDGDGEVTPHLVMELVEGTSLRDLLAERGPSLRAVSVVSDVLDGLAACHRAGILHLDIKPANVLVTGDGRVKIVDFGIARAASDATATIAGTPHYMPPEQYEGHADPRSDIYSTGCLLYECLTGRAPFEGTMAAQLLAHRSAPRPDPRVLTREVGPDLAAVVMRAMAIRPEDRFADAVSMRDALIGTSRPPTPSYDQPDAAAHDAPHALVPNATGAVVTRWSRLATVTAGVALCVFTVMLVPGLVWSSTMFPPAVEHRPSSLDSGGATAWWCAAVAIAGAILLARRRDLWRRLSGPPIGSARPLRTVDDHTWSGVRLSAGAALRGSVPILIPWYVALVAAVSAAAGIAWPDDEFGSAWSVAWLLMPLVAVTLTARGLLRIRPRFGAVVMGAVQVASGLGAALLFVAYPLVAR